MMDEPIWTPAPNPTAERRKEWIKLRRGRMCIWELTTAESTQIIEHSTRPRIDPRGGTDRAESLIWQVALSCYDGDEPGARLIFGNENLMAIYTLPMQDLNRIKAAIDTVNGMSDEEIDAVTDFTRPVEEPPGNSGPSMHGASNTSIGSPAK